MLNKDTLATRTARLALLATWCALATAVTELAMRAIQKAVLHRYIYLGRQIVWWTPAADLLLFSAVAGLLWLAAWRWSRIASLRVAGSALGFVAAFSILTMQPWMAWWAMVCLALGIALQAARLAAAHDRAVRRLMLQSLPVLAGLIALLTVLERVRHAGAERAAEAGSAAPRTGAPNVLVIVWDAVRARSLSLYGYSRPTTPELTAFAGGGVTFDRAIATGSYTLPTHASLFTGLWPHQVQATWELPLDGSMPTLAEALGQRGYRTGAFSANHLFVTWEHGLLRGFAHAEDYVASPGEIVRSSALLKWLLSFDGLRRAIHWYDVPGRRNAPDINAGFLRWLDRDQHRPFFAFLNVYDAHEPYLPPPPFDTLFAPPGTDHAEHQRAIRLATGTATDLAPADLARQRDLYEGAIAWTDHSLGLLLRALEQRGVLRNTLVVIAGDHGEGFAEHGTVGHGNDAYVEVTHVPLVVVLPGTVPAGRRVPGLASLRDVPATILSLVDSGATSTALPGQSLTRFWQPDSADVVRSDTVLSEIDRLPRGGPDWYPVRRGPVRSVFAWPYQLIESADSTELYNLATDPDERQDLARRSEHAATRDTLTAALGRWRRDAVRTKL